MKKLLCCALAALLLSFAACGSPAASATPAASAAASSEPAPTTDTPLDPNADATMTVTDHNGDSVTIPRDVRRVVVADIYPFPSVIAMYLGSAEKLVGIHPTSMAAAKNGLLGELYPEILGANTAFMQGADLNVEALMQLEPDVVFCSAGSAELIAKLRNAGIPAIAVSANKWNYDVIKTYNEWIALLAQVFPDNPNTTAASVAAYSDTVAADVAKRVAAVAEGDKKKVLFLFQYDDTQMVTSGKSFFGQYWCDAVGAKNAAEEVAIDNSNAVITMEQVYTWDPEVIIITNFTATQPDDLYNNAVGNDDWSTVKAVKDKQVFKLPLGSYRTYTPGADTPITLYWLAKQVYPELFTDIDIAAVTRDYYKTLYGVELTDAQITAIFDPNSAVGNITV